MHQDANQVSYYASFSDDANPMTMQQKMNESNFVSKEADDNEPDFGNLLRIHELYDTNYDPDEELNKPSYEPSRKKVFYIH